MMPEEEQDHHFPREVHNQILSATRQNVIMNIEGEPLNLEDLELNFYGSAKSNTKGKYMRK